MFAKRDLTQGSIPRGLLGFALPLILGNLLQQLYNLADTWVVGRFIGEGALAAVGSSYTLMTFLTSILLGLCMGSSVYFSIQYGRQDPDRLRNGIFQSFLLIGGLTLLLNLTVYLALDGILVLLQIPPDILGLTKEYLQWIFAGMVATFLYNFFANLLRSVGDSATPLVFLGISVVLNIGLDILFVVPLGMGVRGAAMATVIAQFVAGLGLFLYTWFAFPALRVQKRHRYWDRAALKNLLNLSLFTCLQQSVMNFGILMVQGLVNSFGTAVMAAFAVAVKIDTIAYMPVQDFGNAFSTFVAQNYGAEKRDRIRTGTHWAVFWVVLFCLVIGGLVCLLAPRLMAAFVGGDAAEVIVISHENTKENHPGHRHSFPPLRLFPGSEPPRRVGGPHHLLPGHPGPAGIHPVGTAGAGGQRHLDCHSHRLVSGRCHRDFALAAGGQKRQDPITHPTKKTSLEASFQGGFCSVRNGVTDSHFPQSA